MLDNYNTFLQWGNFMREEIKWPKGTEVEGFKEYLHKEKTKPNQP